MSDDATSTIVYAVRHGQSVWNHTGRLTGWSDIALSKQGEQEARALREILHERSFDHVWSSPLKRAQHTARLAWGNDVELDARIKEFNFGDLEGVPLNELGKSYVSLLQDFESFHPPNGELGADFFARVDDFFEHLTKGSHLVFTHGGVIRRLFDRIGLKRFPDNASILIFDLHGPTLVEEIPNPLRNP